MRRAFVPHYVSCRLPFASRLAACAAIALCFARTSRVGAEEPVPSLPATTMALPVDARLDANPLPETGLPTAGNQLWLVNARAADPHSSDPEMGLRYWRYEAGEWLPASRGEFLGSAVPDMPTAVYLHGNRISSPQSSCDGWRIYRSFVRQAPAERPFRFVVWSWPSAKIDGELRDVRVKAARGDCQAYYLAWLVDQLPPEEHVGLIGYSYGARIVSGALHILGGGEVAGQGLNERVHPDRRPLRGALLAGAFDNDWLAPGRRHGQAMTQVDRLLITCNCNDPVLRWYSLIDGLGSHREALGYKGAVGLRRWGEASAVVRALDVSGWVGAEHDWTRYLLQPGVVAELLPYALGDGSPAE